MPPRGQATADDGRNRSTAGGYDVFAAGQARAAAYQAVAGAGSGDAGDKDEEGSYSDSSGDVAVERTAVDFIKVFYFEKMARVPTCPIRLKKQIFAFIGF